MHSNLYNELRERREERSGLRVLKGVLWLLILAGLFLAFEHYVLDIALPIAL
jgi:uncharacterized membrane protein YccF (DUF307 family)